MRLIIEKNKLILTPERFLQKAGYKYIENRKTGQASFIRLLGNLDYPRIHLYPKYTDNQIIFNLHLDQKKASYDGSHAHSAEYDSDILAEEIERLKHLLTRSP